jgi:hypothetical protein
VFYIILLKIRAKIIITPALGLGQRTGENQNPPSKLARLRLATRKGEIIRNRAGNNTWRRLL